MKAATLPTPLALGADSSASAYGDFTPNSHGSAISQKGSEDETDKGKHLGGGQPDAPGKKPHKHDGKAAALPPKGPT